MNATTGARASGLVGVNNVRGKPRCAPYTTGAISKITKVAPRTVSKWIDKGELTGYRIPGSNDRRVMGVDLLKFMLKHGMDKLIPAELRAVADVVGYAYLPPDAPAPEGVTPARLTSEFDAGAWVSDPVNALGVLLVGTAFGVSAAFRLATNTKLRAPDMSVMVLTTPEDAGDIPTSPPDGWPFRVGEIHSPDGVQVFASRLLGAASV